MNTDELTDLERHGWDALCDGTGDEFYGSLMTDDAVMVLADGSVMGREQVVRSLSGAPGWDSYGMEDTRLVGAGEDAAVLVYTGRARRGEEPEFVARMSSVYVMRDGDIRLAHYQQTPVGPGPGGPV
jgi:hypothetical protein